MALASRSMASAETCRKSAPFRAGYPPLVRALSAPLQGGLRLLRLSSTPSAIALPCGRASVLRRDEWGLYQVSMIGTYRNGEGPVVPSGRTPGSPAVGSPHRDLVLPCCPRGSCDRGGCALSSGGSWCHRRQWCHLAIRPADLLVQATSLLGLFYGYGL